MMTFLFLLKKLVTDTSGEEIARVTALLAQNGIKYVMRTVRPRGSLGTAIDSRTYAGSNLAMYKGASLPPYVYMVYVRRKDYDRAKDVVCGD
jgi:hypothetical protein